MKTDMNQPGRDCELMTIVIIAIVIIILFIIYVVKFYCMTPCFFDGLNECAKHKELLCWSLGIPFCLLVALLIMIVVYFMKAKKKLQEEQDMDLKKFQMDREWKMEYIKYKDKIELRKLGINMSKEDEKKIPTLDVEKEISSFKEILNDKFKKIEIVFSKEMNYVNRDKSDGGFWNCLLCKSKYRRKVLSLYWDFCKKKNELVREEFRTLIEERKNYIKLYYPEESEEFNRKVESLRMEFENKIEKIIADIYDKECEIFKK